MRVYIFKKKKIRFKNFKKMLKWKIVDGAEALVLYNIYIYIYIYRLYSFSSVSRRSLILLNSLLLELVTTKLHSLNKEKKRKTKELKKK